MLTFQNYHLIDNILPKLLIRTMFSQITKKLLIFPLRQQKNKNNQILFLIRQKIPINSKKKKNLSNFLLK